ncbi:MAG: hypothetical protein BYD32DRAFT_408733 [Podila humilis]|nr:MAG: hypothetical protein BYD32DRAFT_408733 [Podila humilis]
MSLCLSLNCLCVCLPNTITSQARANRSLPVCPTLPYPAPSPPAQLFFFFFHVSSFFFSIDFQACVYGLQKATCISRESKSRCGKVMFGLPGNKPMDKVAVVFCFSFLFFCLAHPPQKRPSLFSPFVFVFGLTISRPNGGRERNYAPNDANKLAFTHHTSHSPHTSHRDEKDEGIVTSKITVCRDRDTTK